jgi:cadmium resistance protein CadD (predicted permease)
MWTLTDWLLLFTLGVSAFVATNLDDSLLLLLFFSDRRYRARHVFAGQALGVGLLILISLASALLALALPARLIGLLGMLPIAIGLKQLFERQRGTATEPPSPDTARGPGWRRTAVVAGTALASGGDNIGVYVPLFATRPPAQAVYLVMIFAVMLVVWTFAGYYLARRSAVAAPLKRRGQHLMPYVLIALGSVILIESFFRS